MGHKGSWNMKAEFTIFESWSNSLELILKLKTHIFELAWTGTIVKKQQKYIAPYDKLCDVLFCVCVCVCVCECVCVCVYCFYLVWQSFINVKAFCDPCIQFVSTEMADRWPYIYTNGKQWIVNDHLLVYS